MLKTASVLAGLALLVARASAPPVPSAALADLAPTGKVRVGLNYGNPVFTA